MHVAYCVLLTIAVGSRKYAIYEANHVPSSKVEFSESIKIVPFSLEDGEKKGLVIAFPVLTLI